MKKIQNNLEHLCWMRVIEIRLISIKTGKKIVYGGNDPTQLNIDISGNKYLSALKDNGVCTISNLTYAEIVRLIIGEFYQIEIWAGYRTTGTKCFFKGYISYISDKIMERRDNTCYILFASQMVAQYSQKRMNLTLNSGINLYAACRYICLKSGIDSSHLSAELKNEFLNEVESKWGTPATLIDQIAQNSSTLTVDTDSSIDGMGVFDPSNLKNKRFIKINLNTIVFTKGNPTLNKDGLNITLLPTFCFKPGDVIIIPNNILDVSISDPNTVASTFKSNYINTVTTNKKDIGRTNGAYMIMELNYHLQNRGSEFEINIRARSLNIIQGIIGSS